jgi:peptidoglycan/xylan/chitin deacetylase (PgdA/CDA1 family)
VPTLTISSFRPLVLCYHSVTDEWEHQLAVRPSAFERQLASLLRRFRPVGAAELMEAPRRALHVTFDDAYADIEGALEILERLGAPATIFASTSFADGGRPLAVPELAAEAEAHPARLATMDWSRLREVAGRGFTIGSHTISHPHLTTLSDAEVDRELAESRLQIEDELQQPCTFLAYPYGEHDERVQAAARRCGYEAAFALGTGASRRNRFALPRADVYRRDSLLRATLKTTSLRPFVSRLRDLLTPSSGS